MTTRTETHESIRGLNTISILRQLQPTVGIALSLMVGVVWAFSTFAQISYVKEQNNSMFTLVEQRHKDAIEHSDINRERVMAVLMDLKESMKQIQDRLIREEVRREERNH